MTPSQHNHYGPEGRWALKDSPSRLQPKAFPVAGSSGQGRSGDVNTPIGTGSVAGNAPEPRDSSGQFESAEQKGNRGHHYHGGQSAR